MSDIVVGEGFCEHEGCLERVEGARQLCDEHADNRAEVDAVVAAIDASIKFAPMACREAMLKARVLLAGK